MRHRTLDTIPPNYSGGYNSMMNFYHDAHAATSGGHFASVSYQITDFHRFSPDGKQFLGCALAANFHSGLMGGFPAYGFPKLLCVRAHNRQSDGTL